jgi:hypothetical protein
MYKSGASRSPIMIPIPLRSSGNGRHALPNSGSCRN